MWCTRTVSVSATCPNAEQMRAMPAPVPAVSGHHCTHTLAPISVRAPRSKAKHVLVRQQLSPEAQCQVAASCRQLQQGRTGACRAPLRAVSRSVGAYSLRRNVADWCCTRQRERWFGLKTLHATNKEGRRERVAWHLVTVSRLETKPTFSLLRRMVEVMPRFNKWCA